jgi:hypothetical protein
VRAWICGWLLFVPYVGSMAFQVDGQRIQVWKTPQRVASFFQSMSADVDSTLPAPRLYAEPPYTWTRGNTIYWNSDSLKTLVSSLGMTLLFFEVQASYDGTELWGFVDADVDSAMFTDLPIGIEITYRLRYYVQDSDGKYAISVWSDAVWSIQDVSYPTIDALQVLNLKVSGEKRWVDSRTIQVRVVATDPDSGKLMQIAFHEKGTSVDKIFLYDIVPPRSNVDVTVPYTMYAPEHEWITLTVWAVDVANQPSTMMSERFFWWEHEEMVCFPNPFFPDRGEVSTITSTVPDITEARIFDPFGNLVRILNKEASVGFFEWDGRNDRGDLVSKGGYICVLHQNERTYCKIAVLR